MSGYILQRFLYFILKGYCLDRQSKCLKTTSNLFWVESSNKTQGTLNNEKKKRNSDIKVFLKGDIIVKMAFKYRESPLHSHPTYVQTQSFKESPQTKFGLEGCHLD